MHNSFFFTNINVKIMLSKEKYQILGMEFSSLKKFEDCLIKLSILSENLLLESAETKLNIRNLLVWLNKCKNKGKNFFFFNFNFFYKALLKQFKKTKQKSKIKKVILPNMLSTPKDCIKCLRIQIFSK